MDTLNFGKTGLKGGIFSLVTPDSSIHIPTK